MTLLVCTTCPRYDGELNGDFADEFMAVCQKAGTEADPAPAIRRVRCLGGCPDEGVVAIDGPQKTRIRFTGLLGAPEAVMIGLSRVAVAHEMSATGDPEDIPIPNDVVAHLSSVTRKRCALREVSGSVAGT